MNEKFLLIKLLVSTYGVSKELHELILYNLRNKREKCRFTGSVFYLILEYHIFCCNISKSFILRVTFESIVELCIKKRGIGTPTLNKLYDE